MLLYNVMYLQEYKYALHYFYILVIIIWYDNALLRLMDALDNKWLLCLKIYHNAVNLYDNSAQHAAFRVKRSTFKRQFQQQITEKSSKLLISLTRLEIDIWTVIYEG